MDAVLDRNRLLNSFDDGGVKCYLDQPGYYLGGVILLNWRNDVEKKARQNPGWSDDGPSNSGGFHAGQ